MTGLIVHEWLAETGGSENVVEEMLRAVPGCDLQVLWNDRNPSVMPAYETWLARTLLRKHKALSLPFQVPTWRMLSSKRTYEWMLVSSHLFAHHARLPAQPDLPKYVYAHTPARYIWTPELDARGSAFPIRVAAGALKPIDRARAQEALKIASNSEYTRERVRRSWGRESDVIYPPVDVERITRTPDWRANLSAEETRILLALPDSFLLGASRMVPYKRLDAVIGAGEATRVPVVLAGAGPQLEALRERACQASVRVDVLPRPSDALLFALYQRARAFIFPAVEDFGIMPVEAMAAGVPVIVPSVGGAAESVRLADGGASVDAFEPDDWRHALDATDRISRSSLPARTHQFSRERFRSDLLEWLPQSASAPVS